MSEISCDEVLQEIEHYLHGELESSRSEQLVEHLAECTRCFAKAEFQRRLREIVRTKCHAEAPEHLVMRVRHSIRLERRIERN